MKDINIYSIKWKVAIGIVGVFFLIAMEILALALVINNWGKLPFPVEISIIAFLLLIILFYAYMLALGLFRLLSRKPTLILDNQGIREPLWLGLIRWEEIVNVSVRYGMLLVRFKDTNAFISRYDPFKQMMMRFELKLFGAPVTIPTGGLHISSNELLTHVQARLSFYSNR